MHHPRLADFFKNFTHPHTSLYTNIALRSSQNHPYAASGPLNPENPAALHFEIVPGLIIRILYTIYTY
ncbi:hypothetical protein DTO166G4_4629 [Paecilomyces variotii]|nr:hypothetical protein DTO166G4_4629 [Paecilomyces variotii]KAJ9238138.1 hypothetical protein DTO166G5_3040 [Paecilomyces variotii]KAJ9249331.1 hypothetical protein DTO195F2_8560 [Paecilomyces variotii]KAJ9307082.1 hypothetical protein DTO217A2_3502 [Paecilomyces variotii]KAJ9356917.1 hypothetical protein DTO280E4_5800 [Paecilomyces variotii]